MICNISIIENENISDLKPRIKKPPKKHYNKYLNKFEYETF